MGEGRSDRGYYEVILTKKTLKYIQANRFINLLDHASLFVQSSDLVKGLVLLNFRRTEDNLQLLPDTPDSTPYIFDLLIKRTAQLSIHLKQSQTEGLCH